MKNDKKHLNINLDFLDENDATYTTKPIASSTKGSAPSATASQARPMYIPVSTGYKYNWKNILIIGSIILFIGWLIFSDGSDSSSSSNSYAPSELGSNNLTTEEGKQFKCSDSDYDKATRLSPISFEGAMLTNESNMLDKQIAANKAEGYALEKMYVNEYDENAVDNYNNRVAQYNTERQRLIDAISSWEQRNDAYNRSIDVYNNFLETNCRAQ
ncbi:hypothetical protein KBC89_00240 [Candidatus Woesebacteria bacterium]|nr:hypothetical protein [Candidatus Woesebacteria bacterium]